MNKTGTERVKTIPETLEAISDEVCDHYCKYTDLLDILSKNGYSDAYDLLIQKICAHCPVSRLA